MKKTNKQKTKKNTKKELSSQVCLFKSTGLLQYELGLLHVHVTYDSYMGRSSLVYMTTVLV